MAKIAFVFGCHRIWPYSKMTFFTHVAIFQLIYNAQNESCFIWILIVMIKWPTKRWPRNFNDAIFSCSSTQSSACGVGKLFCSLLRGQQRWNLVQFMLRYTRFAFTEICKEFAIINSTLCDAFFRVTMEVYDKPDNILNLRESWNVIDCTAPRIAVETKLICIAYGP